MGVTFARYLALKCPEMYRDDLEAAAAQGQSQFDSEAIQRFGAEYTGLSAEDRASCRELFI